jgi:hypothetical protein
MPALATMTIAGLAEDPGVDIDSHRGIAARQLA